MAGEPWLQGLSLENSANLLVREGKDASSYDDSIVAEAVRLASRIAAGDDTAVIELEAALCAVLTSECDELGSSFQERHLLEQQLSIHKEPIERPATSSMQDQAKLLLLYALEVTGSVANASEPRLQRLDAQALASLLVQAQQDPSTIEDRVVSDAVRLAPRIAAGDEAAMRELVANDEAAMRVLVASDDTDEASEHRVGAADASLALQEGTRQVMLQAPGIGML